MASSSSPVAAAAAAAAPQSVLSSFSSAAAPQQGPVALASAPTSTLGPPPGPPPRASLATQAVTSGGKPRIRAFAACIECNKAKVKCDGDKPKDIPCSRCTNHNLKCGWAKSKRGRLPGSKNKPKPGQGDADPSSSRGGGSGDAGPPPSKKPRSQRDASDSKTVSQSASSLSQTHQQNTQSAQQSMAKPAQRVSLGPTQLRNNAGQTTHELDPSAAASNKRRRVSNRSDPVAAIGQPSSSSQSALAQSSASPARDDGSRASHYYTAHPQHHASSSQSWWPLVPNDQREARFPQHNVSNGGYHPNSLQQAYLQQPSLFDRSPAHSQHLGPGPSSQGPSTFAVRPPPHHDMSSSMEVARFSSFGHDIGATFNPAAFHLDLSHLNNEGQPANSTIAAYQQQNQMMPTIPSVPPPCGVPATSVDSSPYPAQHTTSGSIESRTGYHLCDAAVGLHAMPSQPIRAQPLPPTGSEVDPSHPHSQAAAVQVEIRRPDADGTGWEAPQGPKSRAPSPTSVKDRQESMSEVDSSAPSPARRASNRKRQVPARDATSSPGIIKHTRRELYSPSDPANPLNLLSHAALTSKSESRSLAATAQWDRQPPRCASCAGPCSSGCGSRSLGPHTEDNTAAAVLAPLRVPGSSASPDSMHGGSSGLRRCSSHGHVSELGVDAFHKGQVAQQHARPRWSNSTSNREESSMGDLSLPSGHDISSAGPLRRERTGATACGDKVNRPDVGEFAARDGGIARMRHANSSLLSPEEKRLLHQHQKRKRVQARTLGMLDANAFEQTVKGVDGSDDDGTDDHQHRLRRSSATGSMASGAARAAIVPLAGGAALADSHSPPLSMPLSLTSPHSTMIKFYDASGSDGGIPAHVDAVNDTPGGPRTFIGDAGDGTEAGEEVAQDSLLDASAVFALPASSPNVDGATSLTSVRGRHRIKTSTAGPLSHAQDSLEGRHSEVNRVDDAAPDANRTSKPDASKLIRMLPHKRTTVEEEARAFAAYRTRLAQHGWTEAHIQLAVREREAYYSEAIVFPRCDIKDVMDVHALGILSEAEARDLFDFYFRELNVICGFLDPHLHTPDFVKSRSNLLYTAICFASASVDPRPSSQVRVKQLEQLSMDLTLECGKQAAQSCEIVQAELLLNLWALTSKSNAHDRGSVCVGRAVRTAVELGLGDGIKDTASSEQHTREGRNRTRAFLTAVIQDRSLSAFTGRQPVANLDEFHTLDDWVASPMVIAADIEDVAFFKLRLLEQDIRTQLAKTESSNHAALERVRRAANERMASWMSKWTTRPILDQAPLTRATMKVVGLHVQLVLNTVTKSGCRTRKADCLRIASKLLVIVNTELHRSVQYICRTIQGMIAWAAVVVIQLTDGDVPSLAIDTALLMAGDASDPYRVRTYPRFYGRFLLATIELARADSMLTPPHSAELGSVHTPRDGADDEPASGVDASLTGRDIQTNVFDSSDGSVKAGANQLHPQPIPFGACIESAGSGLQGSFASDVGGLDPSTAVAAFKFFQQQQAPTHALTASAHLAGNHNSTSNLQSDGDAGQMSNGGLNHADAAGLRLGPAVQLDVNGAVDLSDNFLLPAGVNWESFLTGNVMLQRRV